METASKEEVKDFVKQSVKELASFELLLKKVLDEQMHLRFQLILYSELMKNILQDKFWSHPDLEGVVKSRSVLHLRTNSEFSETSDILYPLSCPSSDLSSYLPCSDSVHPCFPFCPTLSYLLCNC